MKLGWSNLTFNPIESIKDAYLLIMTNIVYYYFDLFLLTVSTKWQSFALWIEYQMPFHNILTFYMECEVWKCWTWIKFVEQYS